MVAERRISVWLLYNNSPLRQCQLMCLSLCLVVCLCVYVCVCVPQQLLPNAPCIWGFPEHCATAYAAYYFLTPVL